MGDKKDVTYKKDIMNETYEALMTTVFAVAISMGSKKLIREPLGVPENSKGILKLLVAVIRGTLATWYLQEKEIIPTEPFKDKKKKGKKAS